MEYKIGNKNYTLLTNPIQEEKTREAYFALSKKVFGLDFSIWYESGFWAEADQYIPYTLFDQDKAVASVGIYLCDMEWEGKRKKFAQLSTVMTDPDYRKKGLNQWLIKYALNQWEEKCDCVYLYANDSVLDYYPKFGFRTSTEYRYKKAFKATGGDYRKLDLNSKQDVELLLEKYEGSNPYAWLTMKDNFALLMFHCVSFLKDHIYYLEQYDAVVIAECEEDMLFCYDIFTGGAYSMEEILGVLVKGECQTVVLGFTPKQTMGFTVEKAQEEDLQMFVLKDVDQLFENNRVMLPLLSHA